jgi:hypothetical protein
VPYLYQSYPPQYVIDAAVSAVKAAIDNAARLGLTWRVIPASVVGAGVSDPMATPVVLDGDVAAVQAVSMAGSFETGQRVWCVQVPPAGLYVIGIIGERVASPLAGGTVKVQRIGNQNINNDTNTVGTFTAELWDSHGYWNGSGTFTVPEGMDGIYQVNANCCFAFNANGSRAINILQNGNRMSSVYVDTHSTTTWREECAAQLDLVAGDTVEAQVYHNSGAATLAFTGSTTNLSTFAMTRLQQLSVTV